MDKKEMLEAENQDTPLQTDGTQGENDAVPPTQKSGAGKGSFVTSIIFLVLGAAALAMYIASSASFFLTFFDKSNTESAGAAIGAVFALLLSTPLMLLSAPPTLLFLSLSTGFLRKTRKARNDTSAKICFVLSAVLLALAALLTIAVAIVFIVT